MTTPDSPTPPTPPAPPTSSAARGARATLVIGGVMVVLGLFIAARVLLTGAPPLTGTLALDLAFAVFFVARGALAYARFRRAREAVRR